MKNVLMGLLILLPFGSAFAVCPDIRGTWAFTYDEALEGDTVAGVARAVITGSKIRATAYESYQGRTIKANTTGTYTVRDNCTFVYRYEITDSTVTGVVNGVIVTPNKIFGIYGNNVGKSGRVIGERMQLGVTLGGE